MKENKKKIKKNKYLRGLSKFNRTLNARAPKK